MDFVKFYTKDVPYRLCSCNLLFYISRDGFDRLLHQGDVEAVADFDPPAGGGLDLGFQRVCVVLHLGFRHLLDVIRAEGNHTNIELFLVLYNKPAFYTFVGVIEMELIISQASY